MHSSVASRYFSAIHWPKTYKIHPCAANIVLAANSAGKYHISAISYLYSRFADVTIKAKTRLCTAAERNILQTYIIKEAYPMKNVYAITSQELLDSPRIPLLLASSAGEV